MLVGMTLLHLVKAPYCSISRPWLGSGMGLVSVLVLVLVLVLVSELADPHPHPHLANPNRVRRSGRA